MSQRDEKTLISPEIEKDNPSKSRDITVMDPQNPREKDHDPRPHYRATTRARDDGPSRRTLARSTHSHRAIQGDDRELISLLMQDNQKLRETIVDLAKRFPQNSHNQDEVESFTSRSPGVRTRIHNDRVGGVPGEEGDGDNGHDRGKEPIHAENQGVRPQNSGSPRVSALLRIGPNGKKIAAEARQEAVNQPDPQSKTHHRSDEDLRKMILSVVENHGKKEAVTARYLARKALGKE